MEWLNILKEEKHDGENYRRVFESAPDFKGDWKSILTELEDRNPEAAKALSDALQNKNTGSGNKKRSPEDWEIEEARSLSLPIDAYIDITEEASKLAEESTPKSRADIGYIYIMQDKKTKRVEMFFDEDMGNDMGYQTLDYYDLENVISYWEDASFEWYFTQQLEKHKSTGEKEKE
tara:strand:- start:14902 stop:15429 length:528 start_codon:yes stop_codon:yes gene_type:complete